MKSILDEIDDFNRAVRALTSSYYSSEYECAVTELRNRIASKIRELKQVLDL